MLSIVIPVYNNFETLKSELPPFINYLQTHGCETEIVLVDDGSKEIKGITKFANDKKNVLLLHKKNLGKGAAVKSGILSAKGKYILYTDADIPFKYENYLSVYHALSEQQLPIVLGHRNLATSDSSLQTSTIRKIGSWLFSRLVGDIISIGNFDTQCGLKGFNAAVIKKSTSLLTINGFAFDVELLTILSGKYTMQSVPVQLRNNNGSTIKVVHHGLQMLKDLLIIAKNKSKGKYK